MGSHCDATIWFFPSVDFFPFIFRDGEKNNQIANSQGVRCESFAQTIQSIDVLFKLKHFCQPTKPVCYESFHAAADKFELELNHYFMSCLSISALVKQAIINIERMLFYYSNVSHKIC